MAVKGMFQKINRPMYQEKPKRVRDPSLPPPPNLLSHDKIIRGMAATDEQMQHVIQQQQEEIRLLKSRLNQTTYRLDMLTNYIKSNKK